MMQELIALQSSKLRWVAIKHCAFVAAFPQ
jgi:hypothetical protein